MAAPAEDATTGKPQQQAADRPFILPFAEPPGPDTWLLGQTYGNTVGAYFNRNTTYRFSGGIHFGIDLSAPCGTEIVAHRRRRGGAGGRDRLRIVAAQPDHRPPAAWLLQRSTGICWSGRTVTPGQEVKQGEVVALSGDPEETCFGRPHLHLEIRDYPGRGWKYNPVNLIDADWDNLALVGSFRSGFERDLDEPRKWQQLDDQPPAVTGGPILNNFANPWPRSR